METPIQVEDHIPYLWVRVASQCEGQVSQSPMAMRPNKVGVDKGNGRNHIERYTHTPIFSLRLRGGLGWWFGSLGNHCLQHILLKFKVCT